MYIITNGRIVLEDSILEGHVLLIKDDRIYKIVPQVSNIDAEIILDEEDGIQVIDAAGGYVTAGFIDIHSDYIEHMAAPRPTCLMDFRMSLRETEKELAAHGITTMFHSLSLFKVTEYKNKPIRDPENVQRYIDLIGEAQNGRYLIRHRFHARFEIDNHKVIDHLLSYIEGKKAHLVSFMDHTPGQGQYRNLEVYKDMVKSYNDKLNDDEIEKIILRHQGKEKVTMAGLKEISELARENGISVASHDDDSFEKLEMVHNLGATISEFPMTMEIAQRAKEKGLFTMAGAPNILLGGSHNGNLSAPEAIKANCIDILCSDYYPPALLHAVFAMHRQFQLDLVDMFRLVTVNPAKAVMLDEEIGSIKEGKKADLLVIKMIEPDFPAITVVFVDGKLIQQTHYPVSPEKENEGV